MKVLTLEKKRGSVLGRREEKKKKARRRNSHA